MKNISRTIELIANVAIILVVILLGIVLVKTYVITNSPNIGSLAFANQSFGHPKIGLPDVDWSKRDKTLVLAISSTCHFCTESAPFYRQLSGAHDGTQLIAVLPQPVEEGRRYVKELGFEVGKNPAPRLLDPSCCDELEAYSCISGGGEWNNFSCTCLSPIVVDVAGNGFNLTNGSIGVFFDIAGTGVPELISWTATNSDDSWLVLDRNGNGVIDNGKELFGSSTAQPAVASG